MLGKSKVRDFDSVKVGRGGQHYLESFLSVAVITCASHAQGRRFEPGWKQTYSSSFVSLPFVADVDDTH